jgi:hypothetical protein
LIAVGAPRSAQKKPTPFSASIAMNPRNDFEWSITAANYNSLKQISHALNEVGGGYCRNM